jgi:hypothetical protein
MTRSAWRLTCDMLAVYRLAILITQDAILDPVRQRLKGKLPELITCRWCGGIMQHGRRYNVTDE